MFDVSRDLKNIADQNSFRILSQRTSRLFDVLRLYSLFSGAHPTTCPMDTRGYFLGGKAAGA